MAQDNPPASTTTSLPSAGQTLLERVAMPAMFIGIGYLLGFFHGRSSKKGGSA